jgi:hypothetical protein
MAVENFILFKEMFDVFGGENEFQIFVVVGPG